MRRILCLFLVSALVGLNAAGSSVVLQDPAPSPAPQDQTSLTNKDVVEMLKSGLTPEVVVAKIRTSRSNFDTSPPVLAELKAAAVPDSVILEMVQASTSKTREMSENAVETTVKVPDGTEIEVILKNNLSGQEAKLGDIVDFTVVRDVQIDGITIIEKDASARARVTTAKKAGHWGRAGKLEWAMQDVQSVDGNRIPARFSKREVGDSKGSTVAVGAVATTVFLGPAGLLWGLKKGKPAIIPAGNRYSVFVHGDAVVKAKAAPVASTAP